MPLLESFTTRGAGGVGGNVKKKTQGFFINNVFVGVFQYDPGPPKHALELRDYVKYMFSFFISLLIMVWNLRSIFCVFCVDW